MASRVAALLLANTVPGSSAAQSTHTATIARTSSSASTGMSPSATAWVTPAATPAWAGPQVSCEWVSPRTSALFTNSVIGFTGRFGRSTVRNGTCPRRGVASDVVHAVSTGPPLRPITTLMCAAFGPLPANDSPTSVRAANSASVMTRRLARRASPGRLARASVAAERHRAHQPDDDGDAGREQRREPDAGDPVHAREGREQPSGDVGGHEADGEARHPAARRPSAGDDPGEQASDQPDDDPADEGEIHGRRW